ncbi:MAG TPA: RNA polymerase sigma factor SigJ, partial [Povalibacter sp.]|nr:RNA polymerase sigma factor SigJ [Povalibacter sp.]
MSSRADIFQRHHPRLFGIAYRMLGSKAEAEDVVQDTYLRWHAADVHEIRSPEAWLKTAAARLSIDRLRRAKLERESYFGPWLPEPLSDADLGTPELAAEFDSDVSVAFLTVLEALGPEERAAFILHDIIDDDYADVAEALGKTEAACRQLVHRARERVTSRRRRFTVDDATRTRMLEKLIIATNSGDRDRVIAVLAEDATMVSDGGGKARALQRPLFGPQRIAMFWYALARRQLPGVERRIENVNGEPGIALFLRGRLYSVATVETDGQRVFAYYSIVNPDKLGSFASVHTGEA